MEDSTIVDSSFSAIINAPLEVIDIPGWCFGLSEAEYQGCSPAHVAAGVTTAPDGRRLSINVEVIGGVPMVQHYVAKLARSDCLILELLSDLFPATGRTTITVIWDMSVKRLDDRRCEFTNHVVSRATDELLSMLGRQGIPFEIFKLQRQPMSIAHNKAETPFFAASLERHALAARRGP